MTAGAVDQSRADLANAWFASLHSQLQKHFNAGRIWQFLIVVILHIYTFIYFTYPEWDYYDLCCKLNQIIITFIRGCVEKLKRESNQHSRQLREKQELLDSLANKKTF